MSSSYSLLGGGAVLLLLLVCRAQVSSALQTAPSTSAPPPSNASCPACPCAKKGCECTGTGCGVVPWSGSYCGGLTSCCKFNSCPPCAGGRCTKKGCAMCPGTGYFCGGSAACCGGPGPTAPPAHMQGTYGPGCNKTCSNTCANATCDDKTGECKHGCIGAQWYGPKCEKGCNANCKGGMCFHTNGICANGCEVGYQGQHCDRLCPPHCWITKYSSLPACNQDGTCGLDGHSGGFCHGEWTGPKCSESTAINNGCKATIGKTLGIFVDGIGAGDGCAAIGARIGLEACVTGVEESTLAVAALLFDFPAMGLACLGTGAAAIGVCGLVQDHLLDKAGDALCDALTEHSWFLDSDKAGHEAHKNKKRINVVEEVLSSSASSSGPPQWPLSFTFSASIASWNTSSGVALAPTEHLSVEVDNEAKSLHRQVFRGSPGGGMKAINVSAAINCTLNRATAVLSDHIAGNCSNVSGVELPECARTFGMKLGQEFPTNRTAPDGYLTFLLENVFNVTLSSLMPDSFNGGGEDPTQCWSALSAINGTVQYCAKLLPSTLNPDEFFWAPLNITGNYPLATADLHMTFSSFEDRRSNVRFLQPRGSCFNQSFYTLGQKAGQSCTDACKLWNATCVPSFPSLNNSVEIFFQQGITCKTKSSWDDWWSDNQPGFIPPTAGGTDKAGYCLGFAKIPDVVKCDATWPTDIRLCNCNTDVEY